MTADEFKQARAALGLSAAGMADALMLGMGGGRTVRRWEAGDATVSGPVEIAVNCLLNHARKRKNKSAKGA
jgi:DNA-binding transcriptional regulator YiaG